MSRACRSCWRIKQSLRDSNREHFQGLHRVSSCLWSWKFGGRETAFGDRIRYWSDIVETIFDYSFMYALQGLHQETLDHVLRALIDVPSTHYDSLANVAGDRDLTIHVLLDCNAVSTRDQVLVGLLEARWKARIVVPWKSSKSCR